MGLHSFFCARVSLSRILFAHGYYFCLPQIDTDEHGFTVRMVGFEHEFHEFHEYFWVHGYYFILPQIPDEHGFYRADGGC